MVSPRDNLGEAGVNPPPANESLASATIAADLTTTLMSEQYAVDPQSAAKIATLLAGMLATTASRAAIETKRTMAEEQRKRVEDRKRKAVTPVEQLSPVAREKALRKKQRDELKATQIVEKEREQRTATMPMIGLMPSGAPTTGAWFEFNSNLAQVVKANFKRWEFWSTNADGMPRIEDEKMRIIEQVRDRFRNGAWISTKVIVDKISNSLTNKRNHQRKYIQKYLCSKIALSWTGEELKEKGHPSDGKIDVESWDKWIDEELKMRHWIRQQKLIAEQKEAFALDPNMENADKLDKCDADLGIIARSVAACGLPPSRLTQGWLRAMKRFDKQLTTWGREALIGLVGNS